MATVIAVARCLDCGHDVAKRQITNWQRLHLPTNPWADLVALAEAHDTGCFPIRPLPNDIHAREVLRAIAALSRRCTTDNWGLIGLGAGVRHLLHLLPANDQ
jgi:hypothetical protein